MWAGNARADFSSQSSPGQNCPFGSETTLQGG